MANLVQINWAAVAATDFRSVGVKEGKQAEFLVYRSFPWELVGKIGVRTPETARRVEWALAGTQHQPTLEVRPEWYF